MPATPSGSQPLNAPTPTVFGDTSTTAFEPDPDAILADASDETWGVILSHPLNNSNCLVEIRPALASGYLVKRQGAVDADGWAVMSINVISIDGDDPEETGGLLDGDEEEEVEAEEARKHRRCQAGEVLKDVLGMYRGLGVLAKAKGMVGKQGKGAPGSALDANDAVWPWHVATAHKGVRALSYLL